MDGSAGQLFEGTSTSLHERHTTAAISTTTRRSTIQWSFFTVTNGGDDTTPRIIPKSKYYAPLQQLAVDLAKQHGGSVQLDYARTSTTTCIRILPEWIHVYHGVHYKRDLSAIAAGDNFLSKVVPMIEASQAFQNGGTIIIWDDENEGETKEDGKFSAPEIVISKLRQGQRDQGLRHLYSHSSDLRTMQETLQAGAGQRPFPGSAPRAMRKLSPPCSRTASWPAQANDRQNSVWQSSLPRRGEGQTAMPSEWGAAGKPHAFQAAANPTLIASRSVPPHTRGGQVIVIARLL